MARVPFFVLLLTILSHTSTAQRENDALDRLKDSLKRGHMTALPRLASYLTDTTRKTFTTCMGLYITTTGGVAGNIIRARTLFLPHEFDWQDSTANLADFIRKYYPVMVYDTVTEKILITPVHKRTTPYKLYAYNFPGRINRDSLLDEIEEDTKLDYSYIKSLLNSHSNEALLLLASRQYTADHHGFGMLHMLSFERLLGQLTNTLVIVPAENGNNVWTNNSDFEGEARLNQLIYWTHHFKDYQWDNARQQFINTKEPLQNKPYGIELLMAMQSEDDSTAINAFVQMTRVDPVIIDSLPLYDFMEEANDNLPIFGQRFLQVLSTYYLYLRQNNLPVELTGRTKAWHTTLSKEGIPFKERYQAENEVIRLATPDEISALEYWFLVNEANWELSYSAGRIFDKYYSYHWTSITHDTVQLKHYLKKAALFDRLGIIGNCNKYLLKFHFKDAIAQNNLSQIIATAKDEDIQESAKRAAGNIRLKFPPATPINNANFDTTITDLDKAYRWFMQKPHESYEDPLQDLTASINYPQIPAFIALLKKENKYNEVYDFIERDFDLPVDQGDSLQMREFLELHQKLTYKELCTYYLDKCGYPYKKPNGSLDYQNMYEILEFDIVDALAGGGGGTREDCIYLLVKLLEFEFNTTLGFPKKLCNGAAVYGCSADDRARTWKEFLVKKKLAKPLTGMPQSVSIAEFR